MPVINFHQPIEPKLYIFILPSSEKAEKRHKQINANTAAALAVSVSSQEYYQCEPKSLAKKLRDSPATTDRKYILSVINWLLLKKRVY
jgi:hypothetical protein